MRLFLVPHAATEWNAQRRYQGHVDTELSEIGRRQAAMLARRLATESIDEIHTSDLRRARETAQALAKPHDLRWRVDSRLRELRFGAWEGLTFDEVRQRIPEIGLSTEINVPWNAPPGGETLTELAQRIGAYLAELTVTAMPGRTLLIVAHRGSLQVLLCLALGLPAEAWWRFRLESASLSELHWYSEGGVLHRFNDTQHLREAEHAR